MRIKIVGPVLLLTFFLSSLFLNAQTKSIGFKLNPSIGFIRSSHLKKAIGDVEGFPGIKEYDVRSKAGFQFGIGGFFQYEINEKFTVITDPSINYFRAKLTQNFVGQEYNSGGEEYQTTVRSTALIKYFYVNIPVMVKYEILPYQRVFLSAGFSVNVNFKPTIYSDEDSVTNHIVNGEIDETVVKNYSSQAKVDKYAPIAVTLNGGIGKSFLMGRYYNLDIELRYQFPLTGSSLYTSDPKFQSETSLNNVFSQQGKEAVETFSGRSMNNFKASVLSLSIRYILWSK